MVTYNLGSIADRIVAQVDGIPGTISGTELLNIIDQNRVYMEQRTGYSIGSTAIAESYQPALIALSIADVLRQIDLIGADVSSLQLGDFSINKGAGTNTNTTADKWEQKGEELLVWLGTASRYTKVNG